MAQSYIKLTRKGDGLDVEFHESVGKARRLARAFHIDAEGMPDRRNTIMVNLVEIRTLRGRAGRLIDVNSG